MLPATPSFAKPLATLVGGEQEMVKMVDAVIFFLGTHWLYSYHVSGNYGLSCRLTKFTLTQ